MDCRAFIDSIGGLVYCAQLESFLSAAYSKERLSRLDSYSTRAGIWNRVMAHSYSEHLEVLVGCVFFGLGLIFRNSLQHILEFIEEGVAQLMS